ncbi:MAG: hypothetical protein WD557_16190 [Dehalococcoidia bacterium]
MATGRASEAPLAATTNVQTYVLELFFVVSDLTPKSVDGRASQRNIVPDNAPKRRILEAEVLVHHYVAQAGELTPRHVKSQLPCLSGDGLDRLPDDQKLPEDR